MKGSILFLVFNLSNNAHVIQTIWHTSYSMTVLFTPSYTPRSIFLILVQRMLYIDLLLRSENISKFFPILSQEGVDMKVGWP